MKIAIAGYGVEGRSSYGYFAAKGHDVTVIDERSAIPDLPQGAKSVLGPHVFDTLDGYDLIIRTPSLSPQKLTGDIAVWSATNEFFAHCPAPIIGVTGTKGKGTTASLAASMLRQAGKKVHLVGNIGTPALDVLDTITPDDVVVFELSSFQLWDLEKSPHIAIVLMIEADHLEVHADFNDYVSAKGNIARHQRENDLVIFDHSNADSRTIAMLSIGQKISFPSEQRAHVNGDSFWYGEQKICSIEALKLAGAHNISNACAAIDAVWPFTQDPSAIEAGLAAFEGLPHRLKYVRTVHDVRYYDDSNATTPGSAVAAIHAFSHPKILILGGSSKGVADFDSVARATLEGGVKRILLIGETASLIEKNLRLRGVENYEILGSDITMPSIVARAAEVAEPGDVVILTPACASFGMFKNYVDRGDQFIAAVGAL